MVPKAAERVRGCGLEVGEAGDVGADETGGAAGRRDQVTGVRAGFAIDVGQDHVGAGGCHADRTGAPDPHRRPGDDRNPALELARHRRLPS